jgi:monothiol glutaredoxin
MNDAVRQEIETLVKDNPVVLFMKGRRRMPQCGFSAQVVSILDQLLEDYLTVNVLDRAEIREGVKAYSEWPTIPQLYVKGEFVGGADIVTQLFQDGQLHGLLGVEMKAATPPTVTITDGAKAAFADALKENPGTFIRFEVDARFRPALDLDTPKDTDFQVATNGLTVLVSRMSAERANGATIDYVGGDAGGFKIDNPNEPPRVRQMGPKELRDRMKAGEALTLLDVRPPEEAAFASIDGARSFDQSAAEWLATADKDTMLVFMCRSGARSQMAAEQYLQKGYKKVYNLAGGILAWSQEVDPSVPRY